ncbi:DUF4199 domain-containing protein [bacterium]|nr:DUF4199 domain-containing protein [bacterium]
MERYDNVLKSTSHTAAGVALYIGALWSGSFLFTVYGIPLAGDLLGLFSLLAMYNTVRNYRAMVEDISFLKCWKLTSTISLYGVLVTGLVQYVYFQYLDNGRLLGSLVSMLEVPEFRESLRQVMPGITPDELTALLESVTVGSMTAQLFLMNLCLSMLAALPLAVLGKLGKVRPRRKDAGDE